MCYFVGCNAGPIRHHLTFRPSCTAVTACKGNGNCLVSGSFFGCRQSLSARSGLKRNCKICRVITGSMIPVPIYSIVRSFFQHFAIYSYNQRAFICHVAIPCIVTSCSRQCICHSKCFKPFFRGGYRNKPVHSLCIHVGIRIFFCYLIVVLSRYAHRCC